MCSGTATMNVLLQMVNNHESFIPLKISSIWYKGVKRYSYLLTLTTLSNTRSAGAEFAIRLFVPVLP